jgi:hypothetical protein
VTATSPQANRRRGLRLRDARLRRPHGFQRPLLAHGRGEAGVERVAGAD